MRILTLPSRMLWLSAAAILAIPVLAMAQAPMNSPLGALGRTNEAVNAVDRANAPAEPSPTTAPAAGDLDDPLGDDPADFETGGAGSLRYDPEGRRDPFRALTGEAAGTEERKKYENTLRGRLLSEVKLTSILRHPAGNIATFEGGPKKQAYFARVGAQLWDADVIKIDYDAATVIVRQKIEDPRQIKQWRDVPITLWTEEEKAGAVSTTSP